MLSECNKAVKEAQNQYFNSIDPSKGIEGISIEALQMKGFIDGLKAAIEIEPEFEESKSES